VKVLDIARTYAGKVKVHTFGIGSGASQELVKGVAEASNGTYSFCSESDNLKVKVI